MHCHCDELPEYTYYDEIRGISQKLIPFLAKLTEAICANCMFVRFAKPTGALILLTSFGRGMFGKSDCFGVIGRILNSLTKRCVCLPNAVAA